MYYLNLYMMKKRKEKFYGRNVYLLGIGQDGRYLWLEEPLFCFETYWGFGYVEIYTDQKNPQLSTDFCVHTHWDVLHYRNPEPFMVTTFSEREYRELIVLFNRFYLYYEAAKVFKHVDDEKTDYYNKKKIPQILNQIIDILEP